VEQSTTAKSIRGNRPERSNTCEEGKAAPGVVEKLQAGWITVEGRYFVSDYRIFPVALVIPKFCCVIDSLIGLFLL
jgi:hypothetical protein